jgi:hypothetical protein
VADLLIDTQDGVSTRDSYQVVLVALRDLDESAYRRVVGEA